MPVRAPGPSTSLPQAPQQAESFVAERELREKLHLTLPSINPRDLNGARVPSVEPLFERYDVLQHSLELVIEPLHIARWIFQWVRAQLSNEEMVL